MASPQQPADQPSSILSFEQQQLLLQGQIPKYASIMLHRSGHTIYTAFQTARDQLVQDLGPYKGEADIITMASILKALTNVEKLREYTTAELFYQKQEKVITQKIRHSASTELAIEQLITHDKEHPTWPQEESDETMIAGQEGATD